MLFISHYGKEYGANLSLFDLVVSLRDKYNVTPIVWVRYAGTFTNKLEQENIEFFVQDFYGWMSIAQKHRDKMRIVKEIVKNELMLRKIVPILKNMNIDVVYSNSSVIYIGAWVAKKLRCPHVWHIREFAYEHYGYIYDFPHFIVQRLYKKADQIIVISDALKSAFEKKFSHVKTVRIYDGIVISKLLNIRKIGNRPIEFCYVGLVSEGKNQKEVLKACKQLKDGGINEFRLNIVGDGEKNYLKELEEYVNKYGLDIQVKFWGFQSDVSKILDQMDVGIIVSRKEAFGRATVEYMESSMPVIGAEDGATAEIVKDDETGYLFQPGDIDELAELMKAFISNHIKVGLLGKKGYERVKAEFDYIDSVKKVYKILCDARIK